MYSSFHGEVQKGRAVDQVLREYFPDFSYNGVFLDVGAYEPVNISNSYHFERNGWDVHCFEANPVLIEGLRSARKNVYNYAIADSNKDSIEFNSVLAGFGGGSGLAGLSAISLDPQYMARFGGAVRSITKYNVP